MSGLKGGTSGMRRVRGPGPEDVSAAPKVSALRLMIERSGMYSPNGTRWCLS